MERELSSHGSAIAIALSFEPVADDTALSAASARGGGSDMVDCCVIDASRAETRELHAGAARVLLLHCAGMAPCPWFRCLLAPREARAAAGFCALCPVCLRKLG